MLPINPNYRLDHFAGTLQKAGVQDVDILLVPGRVHSRIASNESKMALYAVISDRSFGFVLRHVDYSLTSEVTAAAQRNRLIDELLKKKVGVLEARGLNVTIDGRTPQEARSGLERFGYSTELQRGRR
jgi:hypothetical protein